MPYDHHNTTSENVATFSGEAFLEAMDLIEWVQRTACLNDEGRRQFSEKLFKVMRLTAESAEPVTAEVQQHDGTTGMPDVVKLAGDLGLGHIVRGMAQYITDDPILDAMQYDTVLGWLAKHAPSYLNGLADPIQDTQRDGFWLTHRCHERGREVIKVRSPDVMPDELPMVNAYPVEWIEERFRNKGVI